MLLEGSPKIKLNQEAQAFVNLFSSLGERAESFLPNRIFESLKSFVRLCYEETIDPARQEMEINKYVLELKEAIPGYIDVQLMIYPHEQSKAFIYNNKRATFTTRLNNLLDNELVYGQQREEVKKILNAPNFSVGTPPVTESTLDFLYYTLLGDKVSELRKYRDVIGVKGDIEEAQWNYFLDVLDQMVNQSTHYTTKAEKENFLNRSESSINFKGLNGFIRTVVSGTADTVVNLIAGEVFHKDAVKVVEWDDEQIVFDKVNREPTSIFVVKIRSMRSNYFNKFRWFPLLSRMVFVDDSNASRSTNTSLVFALHNEIISSLNKVHNKKLGALANSQANLRLILDKVNSDSLAHFKSRVDLKIADFERELTLLKSYQKADPSNKEHELSLYKFDGFARQIAKDKYTLSKLGSYIQLVQNIKDQKEHLKVNKELIREFELRTKEYFYSNNKSVHIATVVEGGGRNQIKTYGEFLLSRKLKPVDNELSERCRVILDVIPNNFERTLQNHFHKNFGLNLFLEKYKQYLTKVENEADNQGRFQNFLIDLGIFEKFKSLDDSSKQIIKDFVSGLGNLNITSVGDDVQMIIRDLLFYNNRKPNPFIFFNQEASWEYRDLFPYDRFDLNPFDIDIELKEDGRVDYLRLLNKLERIKSTFQLFDESGRLWDRFCENSTLVINDPSNPTGLTDFNNEDLIKFLKFLNNSKITLFLDEAYNDSVKIEDSEEPKWRTISRYIMNNIGTYSKISMVSSLSTTKNLGATGDRLGSLIASPNKKDVITFASKQYSPEKGNTNSLYILNNVLEVAQRAKKIKDLMEESLPKNASRQKIKNQLEKYIIAENEIYLQSLDGKNSEMRASMFEGSPLHIFLLEELLSLDKLEVLELPDDFKYKGEAFFSYYIKHLVSALNEFRVNKIFRTESNRRLEIAKNVAQKVIDRRNASSYASILNSDGSYLFNIVLNEIFSYQDLEAFAKRLAEERGIAVIPYNTGFVRFSLGDYLEGKSESYTQFAKEFENGLDIFMKYWEKFAELRASENYSHTESSEILDMVFHTDNFLETILDDFYLIKNIDKKLNQSLKISDIKTLYHATPKESGVSINTVGGSKNAVFEFYEKIGQCSNLTEFLNSKAFTKIYENLLPQVYKSIPALKKMDINMVIARYGKPTLLKYIDSKVNFQPNPYILDDPDELLLMSEILLELERILFFDSKTKILTLNANEKDVSGDLARLEGYNVILRKYIRELLLHFNLPFELEPKEPTQKELFLKAVDKHLAITGKTIADYKISDRVLELKGRLNFNNEDVWGEFGNRNLIQKFDAIDKFLEDDDQRLRLYKYFQLSDSGEFIDLLKEASANINNQLENLGDFEHKMISERVAKAIFSSELSKIASILSKNDLRKVADKDVQFETRRVVLFLNGLLNKALGSDYYYRYNHYAIKLISAEFLSQNSFRNEMIQHGITLHKDFEMDNKALDIHSEGSLKWINEVMTKSGVIASEQPVQVRTRTSTDAKKREFPFHKIDKVESEGKDNDQKYDDDLDFVRNLNTLPSSEFFNRRMAKFVENMDADDYRCKIVQNGLVKELYVIQKSYLKYLTDNLRLLGTDTISLKDAKNFVPDIVLFLGAPEKVISFPSVGYFDLKGPNGNIKTVVTPLHLKADYFGNVKKPRLTMLNEKVKEMGGVPVHGSLFAVEEEDGSIFTVQISGDSGVGKSEMLAAMQLKWLKRDLPGIRSIKLIAGDMFHVFPDKEGNLYGIGSEVGDFSRVTDFDPDYIYAYRTLFESAAESNVDDLNSRSTISGFCDISMPYKIDVMLTASNFAKDEAGIKRYANPENFLLYRDSHGERKEKATSGDNPNFQRTLSRYTANKALVEVISEHGNYLDQILDWVEVKEEKKFYLASTYKMIDKIDVEELVNKIFYGQKFKIKAKTFVIESIRFDVIKNRFKLFAKEKDGEASHSQLLDRAFFNSIFNALASTPGGNPFISEFGQLEQRMHLVNILKGGKDGSLRAKKIKFGILSTDLGKKGKEITGPQKAAQDVKELLREVRIANPEINKNKDWVKKQIVEKYGSLFRHHKHSLEVWRYNFYLFQLEEMRKASFARIDDLTHEVKFDMLKGFEPLPKNHQFSPLLLTPAINIELNGFSETYEQLMWLPHNREFAEEMYLQCDKIYIAQGYHRDTVINNMILQLLLLNGYIAIEDLTRGKITEKANRETISAAKFAAVKKFEEMLMISKTPKSNPKGNGKK